MAKERKRERDRQREREREREKYGGWKRRISIGEQSALKEQRKKGETRGMFNVWYPLNKIPRAPRNIVNREFREELELNGNQPAPMRTGTNIAEDFS